MAKPIWTPFYWTDHFCNTPHLSLREHGAYILLLGHYYLNGGLDASESVLHRICRCESDVDRDAMNAVLKQFFVLDGERYRHARADKELEKLALIAGRRAAPDLRGKELAAPQSPAASTSVDTEGQPCPNCGVPVVRLTHREVPSSRKGGFYYEYWFRCPGCRHVYVPEAAKRSCAVSTGDDKQVAKRKSKLSKLKAKQKRRPNRDRENAIARLEEQLGSEPKTRPRKRRKIDEYADWMRNNPTRGEAAMNQLLDELMPQLGLSFDRQVVFGNQRIADVVIESVKLVIEVDGPNHEAEEKKKDDAARTRFLAKRGYRVIRFTNAEVFHEPEYVASEIRRALGPAYELTQDSIPPEAAWQAAEQAEHRAAA